MYIKVRNIGKGMHPSEIIIEILDSKYESHFLFIHKQSLINNEYIDICNPVGFKENSFLVELPRETTAGFWRIWILKDNVLQSPSGKATDS